MAEPKQIRELLQGTSSIVLKLQSGLKLQERSASEKAELLVIIAEVEMVKQLHISDEERAVLCDRLLQLNEPIWKLRVRAKNVERATTYRSIAFEYWLSSEDIYTASEVEMLIQQRIRERAERYKRIHIDEEKLAAAGLIDLQVIYTRRGAEAMDRIRETLKARCRRALMFLMKAPEWLLQDVKVLCEQKNLMKDDPFWLQSIRFLVPHILPEIEAMMKRMPASNETQKRPEFK